MEILRATTLAHRAGAFYVRIQAMARRARDTVTSSFGRTRPATTASIPDTDSRWYIRKKTLSSTVPKDGKTVS